MRSWQGVIDFYHTGLLLKPTNPDVSLKILEVRFEPGGQNRDSAKIQISPLQSVAARQHLEIKVDNSHIYSLGVCPKKMTYR